MNLRASRRTAVFAVATLLAVGAGCWATAAHGVSASRWGLNLVAWALGALACAALSRGRLGRFASVPLIGGALVLAATLLSPGLEGVHRWIGLGPVRLNAAQLVLPAMIVAWTARGGFLAAGLMAGAALLLAAQPDASQAMALFATVLVTLSARGRWTWRDMALLAVVGAAAAFACTRRDPLAPVPEVEGVMRLAAEVSPMVAVLAAVGLVGAVMAPGLRSGGATKPGSGLPLTTYLGVAALAPVVGAYPVPWVGLGVSSILGAWLGFGLLLALDPPLRASR